MKSIFKLALLLGLALAIDVARGRTAAERMEQVPTLRPVLKVLFLGDQGHHRPADRAAQLTPVLAGRGIDVTYTEKLADLNPQNLARYDALLVYANIDEIGPDQEKALLDYVRGGGGFVPVHCASYCFRNSPAYIALVGAQFQRHGTGEFDTKIVDPSHPIMKGFVPFRTWDETYVHTQTQRQGSPASANAGRGKVGRALDLGANRGQGTRLLHGLWPRFPNLAEPQLSRLDRARNSLGVGQGEGLR